MRSPKRPEQNGEQTFMRVPISKKTYKCSGCGEIYTLEVSTDQRALYPQIECEKCGSLCDLYRDPEANYGDIEDVENNNLEIHA